MQSPFFRTAFLIVFIVLIVQYDDNPIIDRKYTYREIYKWIDRICNSFKHDYNSVKDRKIYV